MVNFAMIYLIIKFNVKHVHIHFYLYTISNCTPDQIETIIL